MLLNNISNFHNVAQEITVCRDHVFSIFASSLTYMRTKDIIKLKSLGDKALDKSVHEVIK